MIVYWFMYGQFISVVTFEIDASIQIVELLHL